MFHMLSVFKYMCACVFVCLCVFRCVHLMYLCLCVFSTVHVGVCLCVCVCVKRGRRLFHTEITVLNIIGLNRMRNMHAEEPSPCCVVTERGKRV